MDTATGIAPASLRALFPGVMRSPYLDVAARGLISTRVRAALDAHLDSRMLAGADKPALFRLVEATREGFARLIGAEADEVAFTRNVSDGINAFATALPWRAGDNVVICEDLEHPANIFPWRNLRESHGIAIRTVRAEAGRIPLEGVVAAIDGRTRVVSVASVSFSPGFRFPLAGLGRRLRGTGVLLLVDGAQSVGILQTDVRAMGIDALATSTQKGLLGLYGMGFLYVRRAVAEALRPVYLSRFGVDPGDGHEAGGGDAAEYRLAAAARRFDVGNYNYLGAVAVDQSIRMLLETGMKAVERHACGLAALLRRRLDELGLPVFGGCAGDDLVHIVAIGHALGAEHDATSDAELLDLHRSLDAQGMRHTIRRGILRLSFHIYNDVEDVEKVAAAARQWLAGRATTRSPAPAS